MAARCVECTDIGFEFLDHISVFITHNIFEHSNHLRTSDNLNCKQIQYFHHPVRMTQSKTADPSVTRNRLQPAHMQRTESIVV